MRKQRVHDPWPDGEGAWPDGGGAWPDGKAVDGGTVLVHRGDGGSGGVKP